MKDGVLIVNTARGKLIDTEALIRALESGRAGGAALDVLEKEDGLYYYNRIGDVIANRDMALLRSFPNVLMCPHTAFQPYGPQLLRSGRRLREGRGDGARDPDLIRIRPRPAGRS